MAWYSNIMENTKSKVVKSMSNSTSSKGNPVDKKCRSNATFHTHSAKKRGVYVERKSTKESLNDTAGSVTPKDPIKPPKRPSRGQKRFLSTVLSLLSKSSAGTQCPEIQALKPIMKKTKTDKPETKTFTVESEKPKKKYKSKILNSGNYPPDTFEVLQHRKNITETSSIELCNDNDEESEDIKWSEFLPRLVQPDSEEIQMEKDRKLSHLVKEVAEGRTVKEKRVRIDAKEPPTLVSDVKKGTTKDPCFYNFFVDLLETTFSVYNLKSEFSNDKIPSAVSSKVAFEIDESVANKLNVTPELLRKPSTHVKYKEEPKKEHIDYFKNYPRQSNSPPTKKKNAESLKYTTPKIEPRQSLLSPQSISMRSPLFPKSASLTQKKSFYKKNRKQTLINMLKEQLKMDNQPLEEPQNIFQALQVLAKNKRKTEKTLRFEDTPNELADCMYRSRRLVPKRPKLKTDPNKTLASPKDLKQWQKAISEHDSNHSLKVVNVQDYYGRLKKFKRETTYPTTYSPTSYSPPSFSPSFTPVDSVLSIAFETQNHVPIRPQVIMTVKPINHV